jgi:hypothetical protein
MGLSLAWPLGLLFGYEPTYIPEEEPAQLGRAA